MGRWKTILKLTAHAGRQSVSIQRKLMLYWTSLILGIFAALVLVLSLTGMFSADAEKVRETLQTQLTGMEVRIRQHRESLEAQGIQLSRQISRELNSMLTDNGIEISQLNDNPELLLQLQKELFNQLNTTLQLSQCSGAYLVLDVTTNTEAAHADRSASGLYLRYANLNAQGAARQDVVLFRGISEVARSEQMQLHNRWNLEFDTTTMPCYRDILHTEVDRLASALRWTDRFQLPDTWEDVTLLCVPVLAYDGRVCGMCGVELSSLYSYLSYPEQDSPYGPMITLLAPMEDRRLLLGDGVIGGMDGTYLGEAQALTVREGRYYNTYSDDTGTYIGLNCQTGVRGDSGDLLEAAVLIPESTYLAYCHHSQLLWIGGSLIFFALMLGMSLYLSRRFVQPIVRTIQAIQSDEGLEENQTGISELDALVRFVRSKSENQPIPAGLLPPDIEELFDSFAQRVRTLSTAERGILRYYIEGYEITQIPDLAFVSIHTVKKHNSNIYQKLGISSRDELMLYIELFRRCDRLNELTDGM